MTTIAEDWTLVDALADDPGTLAEIERDIICRAIRTVATATGGIVTAAQIRAALERPVNPHRIGAVVSGFAKSGVLVDTDRMAPSGDKANRNSRRRLPVWYAPNVEAVR